MEGAIRITCDAVVRVPCAGHRVNDSAKVLMLDGGDQFAREVVLDGDQVESFGCAHAVSLSRAHERYKPGRGGKHPSPQPLPEAERGSGPLTRSANAARLVD